MNKSSILQIIFGLLVSLSIFGLGFSEDSRIYIYVLSFSGILLMVSGFLKLFSESRNIQNLSKYSWFVFSIAVILRIISLLTDRLTSGIP